MIRVTTQVSIYLPSAVCVIFIQEVQLNLYQPILIATKTLLTQSERRIRHHGLSIRTCH